MDIVETIAGWTLGFGFLALIFSPAWFPWVVRRLRERRLVKDREEWYAALQRGETRYSYEEWRNRREGF